MDSEHDFSALRNLLALRKLEVPMDTEVNRFLIEFHRRQRAGLLVPESRWSRAVGWIRERAEAVRFVPSLSYASGFAAVALMVSVGFSRQVEVSQVDGLYKLSLRPASSDTSFAFLPSSLVREPAGSPASITSTDGLTFTPASAKSTATRFVLANSRVAYDATAAF